MDALSANRSWQPSCSHGTYQHEAITSRSRQLLMMGTWLPETCWATSRREIKNTKVTSTWFYLTHTELRCTVSHTQEKKCTGKYPHFNQLVANVGSSSMEMSVMWYRSCKKDFIAGVELYTERFTGPPVQISSLVFELRAKLNCLMFCVVKQFNGLENVSIMGSGSCVTTAYYYWLSVFGFCCYDGSRISYVTACLGH